MTKDLLITGPSRYSLPMRILHWIRAALILGLIGLGWIMTALPEDQAARFGLLYPVHKEFGILAFCIGVTALIIRSRSRIPAHPHGIARWEAVLSTVVQRAMLILTLVVPLMGYAMSSSFTQSDGVPFFFGDLPELLPKNDRAFAVFAWLHKVLAYSLLALISAHILGVIKHRFFDRDRENDVLSRML